MRANGTVVESTFINGLVTEATGLNFPEGAVVDCENVVIKSDGSIERRLGIDYENNEQFVTVNALGDETGVQTSYLWTSVNGDGDVNILVRQSGNIITFHSIAAGGNSVYINAYDLTNMRTSVSFNTGLTRCSFTSGKGYLFITNQYCEPFYIKYTPPSTFTATAIPLYQRDFEGVDDGLTVRQRINTLSDLHRYNLYNQGWFKKRADNSGGNSFPLVWFFSQVALYPSNSDIVTNYLNSNNQMAFTLGIYEKPAGYAQAPKGYFVIPCFNIDRTAVVAAANDEGNTVPTVPVVTSGNLRPSCVAFYAGRIFYAGTPVTGFSDKIYFSETITGTQSFGKCYQVNDPTSDDNPDLLATDGGVISVNDIGTVYHLFPTQRALIVFASNGIWTISGTETAPFKATDYSVYKISSIVISNPDSIVDVLGSAVFWNKDGIWSFSPDQSGNSSITSISDKKLKTYLNSLPASASQYASGDFNAKTKIIQWSFRSTPAATQLESQTADRILCLDLTTNAFYIYKIATSLNYKLCGVQVVYTKNFSTTFKYMMVHGLSGSTRNICVAEEWRTDYKDWTRISPVDYVSSFKSGYKLNAEANKKFEDNYVTFYMKAQPTSSAFLKAAWDFTTNALDARTTEYQQLYGPDTNVAYTQVRRKIRGTGKSISFWVSSDTNKPFSIIGWSCNVSGNTQA